MKRYAVHLVNGGDTHICVTFANNPLDASNQTSWWMNRLSPRWAVASVVAFEKEINKVKGVWVVWYMDNHQGVVVAVFAEELDALRYVSNYTQTHQAIRADFLEYGKDFFKFIQEHSNA